MINLEDIEIKDYKTLTYKGVDIKVSPELLQDIHAGTQPLSLIEEVINKEYVRLLPLIRNRKINLILS
jgi:hypothetical protein